MSGFSALSVPEANVTYPAFQVQWNIRDTSNSGALITTQVFWLGADINGGPLLTQVAANNATYSSLFSSLKSALSNWVASLPSPLWASFGYAPGSEQIQPYVAEFQVTLFTAPPAGSQMQF